MYDLGDRLLMVASDRISAYDVVLPTPDPGQGQGAHRAVRLLVRAHRPASCPTTCVSSTCRRRSRGRAMVVPQARHLPGRVRRAGLPVRLGLEGVPRERSGLRDRAARRACSESDRLPEPIFTPATKAERRRARRERRLRPRRRDRRRPRRDGGAAPAVARALLARRGARRAQRASSSPTPSSSSGATADGEIVLADEVLTPDSSRFWPLDSYEPGGSQPSFDKQYVRDWLDESGWDHSPPGARAARPRSSPDTRQKYVEAYERMAGEPFDAPGSSAEGPRPDPAQGGDPRPPGPGGRARAAGARVRGRLERARRPADRARRRGGGDGDATRASSEMCERLLANPLIESYEVQPAPGAD